MRRILHTGLLVILLATVLQQSAQAGGQVGLAGSDWPMFQHDTRHSGQGGYTGISSYPVQIWKKFLPPLGGGESGLGMSVGPDGTVYVAASGTLFAVDLGSRTIKWSYPYGGNNRSVPAVAENGTLYWGYGDSFAAIKPNGDTEWGWQNLDGNYVFGSSPVIDADGNIYFSHDGVWSLTPQGQLRWFYASSFFSHSSPAIGPDGSIYASTQEGLVSLKSDGSRNWLLDIHTNDNTPVVAPDGTIYVGANDNLYTASGKMMAITPNCP